MSANTRPTRKPCRSAALSTLRATRKAPYPVTTITNKAEIKEV
jgi:hypothetical protein